MDARNQRVEMTSEKLTKNAKRVFISSLRLNGFFTLKTMNRNRKSSLRSDF
jgi:hypothetical protein